MKATLYSSSGEKKSEISLPEAFDSAIREDMALKYFEVEKFSLRQPYAGYSEAGKRHSASGIISHRRHKWKTAYGKGISRVPRKIMSRRGTQFYWVGAEVSNTRGGRSSHPPKGIYTPRKINKKEKKIAIYSGLAATANPKMIKKRYSSMQNSSYIPSVIESLPNKTKSVLAVMNKIFPDYSEKVFKNKSVRSGKGKKRSRKYKSNAGLLFVVGKDEKVNVSGLDVKTVSELRMKDLYPLGRIALYTQKSLEEIKNAA